MEDSNNFIKFIKAVGTGTKHNYDLSKDEMKEAMNLILKQVATPEQISAFLLGWRLKPETIDEFNGALEVFDTFIIRQKIENSIELGYPYDGKRNNPYLFPIISKILQPYDINIVVTGDMLQPAKEGITTQDIAQNIEAIKNLYYFERKDIFKQLSNLTKIRNNLGIRTGLNTIERLPNPALSEVAFIGVFHKPFMEKYVQMFSNRYKKLIVIKGNEGTSEIYSKCQYWIIENGQTKEYKIDPKDFGINYTKSWDRISLQQSLDNINNPSNELIKIAMLNAALILFTMGKTKNINEAYDLLYDNLKLNTYFESFK